MRIVRHILVYDARTFCLQATRVDYTACGVPYDMNIRIAPTPRTFLCSCLISAREWQE